MRRVGRRKLYTRWGPVECAQAVSRYYIHLLVQITLVLLKGFFSDVMIQHFDWNARPLPRPYHWKCHSTYHMWQSYTLLNLNLPSPSQCSWWMIVWYEFPGTDGAVLELLALISADLFGCSKQLHVNENMSMHHANVIQGFLNVCESVEINVWLRGQITYMVRVLSEPCFLAMSFSNPFLSMESSWPYGGRTFLRISGGAGYQPQSDLATCM